MDINVKQVMVSLRPEIDAFLAGLAKKHGLEKLRLGNGTYSPEGNFIFKLEGLVVGGLDKHAEGYKVNASLIGLPPLGTVIVIGGLIYKTAGLKGSKVIMARVKDGKRYVYPVDVIRRLAKVDAPTAVGGAS